MNKGDRYAGRFTILGLGGSGGTARVYKAFDDESQRVVALKVFETVGADADVIAELWNRETTALRKLKHEAIACYLDAGRDNDDGFRFIVIEWIDGDSLEQFLDRLGRVTWDDFFERVGRKILPALVFAAECDIAHRDLSTSNVLVSANDAVKIIDFGQARISRFTVGRTVAGWRTAPYCPPEEDTGSYTYTRDPYSFCAIAVRALAGYQIKDHDALYRAFAEISLPDAVRAVFERALSRDPAQRFPNSIEFNAALAGRQEEPVEDLPIVLPIRAIPTVLERIPSTEDDHEASAFERLLSELNDAIAVAPSTDSTKSGTRLDIETQSCRVVVDIDATRADHLVIVHATPKRFRLDSLYQGERWTPNARFANKLPTLDPDRVASREAIARLYRGVEEFQASLLKVRRRPAGRAVAEWGRLLDALRHIARNESPPLRYTKLEGEGRWLTATVEDPEGAEEEQVRTISVEGGRWVFRGEIDLIRGNQIRLVSTRPRIDLDSIPRKGVLELDWQQTKVALDRQARAVDRYRSGDLPNPKLGRVLTGEERGYDEPSFALVRSFFDATLDAPKKEIVSRCAAGIDLLVTHGPPGTGKTKLIVELIRQTLETTPDAKILLVSQTHAALDNALERLLKSDPEVSCVRIGSGSQEVDPRVETCTVEHRGKQLRARVEAANERFLEAKAKDLGLSHRDVERGLRALDVLGLRERLAAAKGRQVATESELEELKKSETKGNTAEITNARLKMRNLATDLDRVIGEGQVAESELSVAVQRLVELSPEGRLLAQASNTELRMAAGQLTEGRERQALGSLMKLAEDWRLRFGVSDDFRTAIIASSSIVAGTCVGFCREEAASRTTFDLCIIDEAGKATTTELLVPLAQSRRAVIVGDHHQLPAVVDHAIRAPDLQERFGVLPRQIEVQLFEELTKDLPAGNRGTLSVQYRMRGAIGSLVGTCFYAGALTTDESTGQRDVPDLSLAGLNHAVTWLDPYVGAGKDKFDQKIGTSYVSARETTCIVALLRRLAFVFEHSNLRLWPSVAVITGYAQQCGQIRTEIRRDRALDKLAVECATVHAFQGREVDICIYSVTRRNPELKIGMISDWRHLNVALSRARDFLVIVGSTKFCRDVPEPNPFRPIVEFISNSSECIAREWSDD